jgi:hypothetical protein
MSRKQETFSFPSPIVRSSFGRKSDNKEKQSAIRRWITHIPPHQITQRVALMSESLIEKINKSQVLFFFCCVDPSPWWWWCVWFDIDWLFHFFISLLLLVYVFSCHDCTFARKSSSSFESVGVEFVESVVMSQKESRDEHKSMTASIKIN